MKKLHVVALSFIASVSAFTSACTSLLGDFEIVPGRPDGGAEDVSVPPVDAPVDAGDAANDYAKLACIEVAGTKKKLGTLPVDPNNDSAPDRIWLMTYPVPNAGGRMRAVALVNGGFNTLHAYVHDVDGGNTIRDVSLPFQGQVLVAKRYPGGIAVLVSRFLPSPSDAGGSGPQVLEIVKLPDDGAWTAPVAVTAPGAIGGASGDRCVHRLVAGMHVRDAARDEYDVVFAYQEAPVVGPQQCGNSSGNVKAVHVKAGDPSTVQNWPLPGGVTELDFPEDAFVIGSNSALVMFNPSPGNGAPPPGLAAYIVQADPLTLAHRAALKVPLKDPQDFILAAGMKPQGATDTVGVAFIEANLGNSSSKPTFYVGSVQPGNLSGITPSNQVNATELAGLTDLPVDKASYHWESFATPQPTNNFLAIARAYPSAAGFNFIWWDAQGRPLAQRTTTSPGGTLVKPGVGGVSRAANITFRQPPSVLLANMQLAWVEGVPSMPYDVWTTEITCTK